MTELEEIKEALMKCITAFVVRGDDFFDEEQILAQKALSKLEAFLATPNGTTKDRYHYGYVAAKKELAEKLNSEELLQRVANNICYSLFDCNLLGMNTREEIKGITNHAGYAKEDLIDAAQDAINVIKEQ